MIRRQQSSQYNITISIRYFGNGYLQEISANTSQGTYVNEAIIELYMLLK